MSILKKNNITVIEITEDNKEVLRRKIHNVARRLRQADYVELSAICDSPYADVLKTVEGADRKWIIIKSEDKLNIPIALFGVTKESELVGIPWMVATAGIKSIGKYIMKNFMEYINIMMDKYEFLHNYVHVDNETSIRWLKRCGFTFEEPQQIGTGMFHQFHMGVQVK